jgi:hypothetical protein
MRVRIILEQYIVQSRIEEKFKVKEKKKTEFLDGI